MLGWSGSGFFERESHHLLIARRVPRNWGQQDRNCSCPQSTVISAGAGWLSQPPQTGQLRLASSQMQVAGMRAWSPKLSTVRTEPGDCTEEVSEVVKSLEQPPCLSNANAILKESVLFCSLRVLTSNHRAEKIHPGIPTWRKGSGGGSGQVSGSGKHIPTSRVNPRAHTLSKALPSAHRGPEFIRVPRSCCIKLPPANAALTLSKMQSKLLQSIEVSGTSCPFTIMYKK